MSIQTLLDLARAEGMILTAEGTQLRIIRPKNEITDALVRQMAARKPEILAALNPCCGQHPPGVADQPLVLACQLCPASPTYWRTP